MEGCFLQHETILVPVPKMECKAGIWHIIDKNGPYKTCTPEGFLDLLADLEPKFPGEPFGAIWLNLFEGLCPVSFIEPEVNYWMGMESFCAEYHCLPCEGSMFEQPAIIMEIFETIRGAKGQYYQWRTNKDK